MTQGPGQTGILAVLAALLLLGTGAEPASAIEIQSDGRLTLSDTTGAQNNVVVSQAGPAQMRITDTAGVTAPQGPLCTVESAQSVVCGLGVAFVTPSIARLEAGDDSLALLLDIGGPFDVFGGPGNDTITGFGNDGLGTAAELDRFLGGAGDDLLIGNDGKDSLLGGLDDDVCIGGGAGDICRGSGGNDRCDMGPGKDDCSLARGRDTCLGGADDDDCLGGRGRDRCDGGPGDDEAFDCERTRRFEFVKP